MLSPAACGPATRLASLCLLAGGLLAPAQATVIRIETSLGDIDVRLFDTATPLTRDNFVGYAERGDYEGSVFHRSVPGFIVQGGGFIVDDTVFPLDDPNRLTLRVPQQSPVQNEPGISNLRGTIAMAKLGGDPNSATNQWFFNLADNSANLDFQNGGFTVFGRIVGEGETVDDLAGVGIADQIAGLDRINAGGAFTDYPVTDIDQVLDQQDITTQESVVVTAVNVLDIPDGDYNFDGVVDALDYTIWRDTDGSTTLLRADGNGDGVVDVDDYDLWETAFGGPTAAAAAGVPEPTAFMLTGLVLSTAALRRRA